MNTIRIEFSDIFCLDDIQRMQDLFSDATGVASLITQPDGTPITKPSNFCRLCNDIIRKTEKGSLNCKISDETIGRQSHSAPVAQKCLSCGLWDASVSISVEGNHLANWLIGQVRNEEVDEKRLLEYADEIGVNRIDFMEAFHEVTWMSSEQFRKVSEMLFAVANELSKNAYYNHQLKVQIKEREKIKADLIESKERLSLINDSITDSIYSYDIQGRFVSVNKRLREVYNLEESEILGHTHAELGFPKNLCDEWESLHQKVYKTNKTVVAETHAPLPNGEIRFYEVILNPLHDENKKIIGIAGISRDISERKKSDNIIKQSEEKYRLLTDNSADVIWVLNLNKRQFVYISPSVFQLRGFTVEEAMNQSLEESVTPESLILINNAISEYYKVHVDNLVSNNQFIFEIQQICKDGSSVWVEISLRIRLNSIGEIEIVGSSRNIEDRKKSEAVLQKWLNMFKNAKWGIAAAGAQSMKFELMNPYFAEMHGYSVEELVDKSVFEMFAPEVQSSLPDLFKIVHDTGHHVYESLHIRKDGSIFPVLTDSTAIKDELGNVIYRAVNVQDITERKQLDDAQNFLLHCGYSDSEVDFFESLARYLSETLNMEYVCIDRLEGDGLTARTVAIYNDGLFETNVSYALKETPCGDVVGKTICCFPEKVCHYFPNDVALSDLNAESYIGTTLWGFDGKPIGLIAIIGRKPMKNTFLAESLLKMVAVRAAGEMERKQVESEIKSQNQILQKLNAEKDKFFSIIAHDLRSPLAGLMGLTELLSEELPNMTITEIQKFTLAMQNSASNLFRLLENLLQWSQVQHGSISFKPEKLRLLTIIDESISMVLESARNKELEIKNEIDDRIMVMADNHMLQTIIRNLVSNAVKFTPKKGEIIISAKCNSEFVEISVRDKGIGMTEDIKSNLFRIDINTSRLGTDGETSSGIGLLLCKEFIEKHGSRLIVESEEGKGSDFIFSIPIGL